LKSNGNEASPRFRLFSTRNVTDKYLPVWWRSCFTVLRH